jgi:hypothetical protein
MDLIERGAPGIYYYTDPQEINDRLVILNEIRQVRCAIDGAAFGKQPMQRVFIVAEEMNLLAVELREWWDSVRQKSDPKTPPGVRALGKISATGRSSFFNLVMIAQLLTAQSAGGSASRENASLRILARHTVNAWKMLVPEYAYVPKTKTRGRMIVCMDSEATEVQVPLVKHDEAVQFVLSARSRAGVVPGGVIPFGWDPSALPDPEHFKELRLTGRLGVGPIPMQPAPGATQVRELPEAPAGPLLVGLSEACRPGGPLDGMSLAAARKARQRPGFPPPSGTGAGGELLYSRADLADWSAARTSRPDQPEG